MFCTGQLFVRRTSDVTDMQQFLSACFSIMNNDVHIPVVLFAGVHEDCGKALQDVFVQRLKHESSKLELFVFNVLVGVSDRAGLTSYDPRLRTTAYTLKHMFFSVPSVLCIALMSGVIAPSTFDFHCQNFHTGLSATCRKF